MDVQSPSVSDIHHWSSYRQSAFGIPPKKWKSSYVVGRNNNHFVKQSSKIGRTTSPIRIKLIPYSTTVPCYEDQQENGCNNENLPTTLYAEGGSPRRINRNNNESAETSNKRNQHQQQIRLTNSSSPPPKLSCSPSSNNNNINNKPTCWSSPSSSSSGERLCYDKAVKSCFTTTNINNVEKSTSISCTSNGAKLRAAKSESSLRAMMMAQTTSTVLSDRDQDQVEMMYSSRGTKVFVCSCLANLYFNQNSPYAPQKQIQWELIVTGIPVVVLDCGETRSRSARQLQIILAERGTGFTLWKEVINDFTKYEEAERTFHTLLTSAEPSRLAGLSFDDAFSAAKFYQHVKALSNENSGDLPPNGHFKKSSEKYNKQRRHSFVGGSANGFGGSKKAVLRKAEISTPVCFKHITSVKPADVNPVIMCNGGSGTLVPKRAQSCVQILTVGDGSTKSIQ